MKAFREAEWIWPESVDEVNEYADLIRKFKWTSHQERTILRICSKSDYAVWLNGEFIGFNQYHDYPDEKVYDEYDLQEFLKEGENRLAVKGLSMNYATASRIPDGKGVIFEIIQGEKTIVFSDERTQSRISKDYKSGRKFSITPQLGGSFEYDFNGQDTWITKDCPGFGKSRKCCKKTSFRLRPIERLQITWNCAATEIKTDIYDLQRESAGYLYFSITAEQACDMTVCFGEHLEDGEVRQIIAGRNFSVLFHLKEGENIFSEYFLRFGLRYLQVKFPGERAEVKEIGIHKCRYPVHVKASDLTGIHAQIYDTSVWTLENCMHEHYEDCPWREQAQYTMDSRIQMLCGYLAFEEYRFPRAAILLMIHSLTEDKRLHITTPGGGNLTIPSYCLVYFLLLKEYVFYSRDTGIIREVYENAKAVLDGYIRRMKDGLLPMICSWNFLEWNEGLDNAEQIQENRGFPDRFALPQNAFLAIALESFADLSELIGIKGDFYRELSITVKRRMLETFFEENSGLFYTYCEKQKRWNLCEYSQVMALYVDLLDQKRQDKLIKVLLNKNDLIPLSLCNYIYKYEVLFRHGGYEEYILREMTEIWGKMVEKGATSFWETELGAADFGGAGSLCHGWSAIPVYCYHELQARTEEQGSLLIAK